MSAAPVFSLSWVTSIANANDLIRRSPASWAAQAGRADVERHCRPSQNGGLGVAGPSRSCALKWHRQALPNCKRQPSTVEEEAIVDRARIGTERTADERVVISMIARQEAVVPRARTRQRRHQATVMAQWQATKFTATVRQPSITAGSARASHQGLGRWRGRSTLLPTKIERHRNSHARHRCLGLGGDGAAGLRQ